MILKKFLLGRGTVNEIDGGEMMWEAAVLHHGKARAEAEASAIV